MSLLKTIKPIPPISHEEEARLHAAWKAGDKEAGNNLIRSQVRWMYNLCKKICKESIVSEEEVFADLMLDVAQSLDKYKPSEGRLITYLTRVIRRRSGKYLMKHADHISGRRKPEGVTEEDVVSRIFEIEQVDDANGDLDELGLHLEEILELVIETDLAKTILDCRKRDMGICDIAKFVNLTPPQVHHVITSIAARVLDELDRRGIDLTDFIPKEVVSDLMPIVRAERVLRLVGFFDGTRN